MQKINDLIGQYKYVETSTNNFSTEFLLNIFEDDIKIRFKLEMTVAGNFGKIGRTWLGICIDRDDFVSLIAEKEIDWTYTVIDNKNTENEKVIFEILPVEIYSESDTIILKINAVNKEINLVKVQK
jgi:hypothetical protein